MEQIVTQTQCTPKHFADLLADILQRLRWAHDRNRSLEADVEIYRMGWQQAIHALHDLTIERDALRRSNRLLHEERREMVATTRLLEDRAA